MLSTEVRAATRPHALPARGACFGFAIHSDETFETLRPGGGEPLVVEAATEQLRTVGELLYEWRDGAFHARLFFGRGAYVLAIDGLGSIEVDPAQLKVRAFGIDEQPVWEDLLLGLPLALCSLERGDVVLHGAAVEVDGGAVVLAGPGMSGKSTLAAAFAEAGHGVLSEDMVCLSRVTRAVLPGPAAVRLRQDVAASFASGRARVSTADRTRLTYEQRVAEPVPLRAIVFLRSGDGAPALERLTLPHAMRDLWALTLRLTQRDEARSFRGLVDCASGVQLYDLRRRLRVEDLPAVISCVADAVR